MLAAQDKLNETPMNFASENQLFSVTNITYFVKMYVVAYRIFEYIAYIERITIIVIVILGLFKIYTQRTVCVIRINNDRRQY